MKNILILEDNIELNRILSETITRLGYNCEQAFSLKQAYDLIEHLAFDLILLDRELPDGDSFEIIEYLADCYPQTRLLILSRHALEHERITGYKKGADDYLPKPFSLKELHLKIQILVNRTKTAPYTLLVSGDVKLNPDTLELYIHKDKIVMRKKEADILACLMRHQNSITPRKTVIDYVWGYDNFIPSQTTLDVYIRRIRIILKKAQPCIKTIRGTGYLLSVDTTGK